MNKMRRAKYYSVATVIKNTICYIRVYTNLLYFGTAFSTLFLKATNK